MAQLQGRGRAVGSGDSDVEGCLAQAEIHHANHAFPISVAAEAQKRYVRFGVENSGLEPTGKCTVTEVYTYVRVK